MAVSQAIPREVGSFELRIRGTVGFLVPLACLVLLWEGIARLGFVNPALFPPASVVFERTSELLSAEENYLLWKHIARSLYRLAVGCGAAIVLGILLGTAMGMVNPVYRFFTPILSIIIPIPSIAWVPIVILWLGLGNATPMFIVFISAIFPILYNTSTGVRSINRKHLWAAQTMGANSWQILSGVILPSALAYIITGLRLALAAGWRSLVGAEMLSATGYGIGYMIFEAKDFLQIEVMYAGIVTLAILGFILENGVFGTIEQRTLRRWGMLRDV